MTDTDLQSCFMDLAEKEAFDDHYSGIDPWVEDRDLLADAEHSDAASYGERDQ